MAIMTFMGKGVLNLFIALGLLTWVRTARMNRGSVMQLKEKEYRKKQQGRPSSQEYGRQTEIPCYRATGDTGLLYTEKQGKKRRHIGKRIPEGMFP